MIYKYKSGYGGNYTIKWLIRMYGFKRGFKIYINQEWFKLKNLKTLLREKR